MKIRVKIKYIIFVLFWLLILYFIDNTNVEKTLFVNEIFSISGLIVFVYKHYHHDTLKIGTSTIEIGVFMFIILTIIYAIISIPIATSVYFYARHIAIIYPIFSFYLGFYYFETINKWFLKLRKYLFYYLWVVVVGNFQFFLGYFPGSILYNFTIKKATFLILFIAISFNLLYGLNFKQSTALVVALFFFFILFFRKYWIVKLGLVVMFILLFGSLGYFATDLEKYDNPPYALYGNVKAVSENVVLFQLDPSIAFRMILYYRLLIEDFPSNMIGKGIGTPLISYVEGMNTWKSNGDDEHDAHVTGAHNTYITIFARFGMFSLIFFLFTYNKVFNQFFRQYKYYNNRGYIKYFYAFLIISIIGMFNLVLESPIFASCYWILLGFVSKIIKITKKETGENLVSD